MNFCVKSSEKTKTNHRFYTTIYFIRKVYSKMDTYGS